ncbi:hypothetical protein AAFN85_16440 [Mucilaginibacter sp. CAU 1740]|uniref:hypothetical protein n=1 Tax=Mucilaginibacter sp. CAU 1740 TaxID=3140365 RepID=UPI00325B857A
MIISELLTAIKGNKWASLATEIRPSTVKTESGEVKPLYCSREFEYLSDEGFTLRFVTYADAFGKVPLVEMNMAGHIQLGQPHPIIEGAFEIDYTADSFFVITIKNVQLAAALNQSVSSETGEWVINEPKQILGKSVPAFGLQQGQPFKEYDLILLKDNMLFNGARHIDGRPFDSPANRPTNLQIPLRKS